MKSAQRLIGFCALAFLAFALPRPLAGADPSPAEEVLKAKNLQLVGIRYVLETDAQLSDWMRQVRLASSKVNAAVTRRSNLERDIRKMESSANDMYASWLREKDKLAHIDKGWDTTYNIQVDKVNGIRARILQTLDTIKKRTDVIQTIGDPSDEYVAITMKFGAALDATMEQYKVLAADADVQAAVAELAKASGKKLALGPSDRLRAALPDIQKLRERVNSDTINFESSGGVPTVPVTLNGTLAVHAIVDSGAAAVTISDDVAKQLGITPGPNDKVTHMVTADGTVTEVHVMLIKSVRLGKFTIENVECIVQPPSDKQIDTLLGGTFLRRFVYKMDLGAGQLKLSQILDSTVSDAPTPAKTTAKPVVKPDGAAGKSDN